MPHDVVIVDAVRTPNGKRNGALSGWHPAELLAHVLSALAARTGIDPVTVDDVMVGCVTQVGAQSNNLARSAVLAAGWPESVPACTIDRQCGSSQQAIHFAAQSIAAGANDIVVAAGVESMSAVPMFSNITGELSDPYGAKVRDRYAWRDSLGHKGLIQQGIAAELMVDKFSLTREELDAFSLSSQQRAAAARDSGAFNPEIVSTGGLSADEGIRESSIQSLAKLAPVFVNPGGRITAGNASQISDGAAALLLMSADKADALGLTPMVRIAGYSVKAGDPVLMLDVPIDATRHVLDRAGLQIDDVGAFEVNEAFASVVLAWQKELGADPSNVNARGGAIALGHPLGASGARLMTTLVHRLVSSDARYGLEAVCEAGGMANATLVEALG